MSPRHILLVDDDANILTTLGMRLETLGYQVNTASDGPSAIVACSHYQPDLMLLDLRLPGMDGIQVLEQVKQQQPDIEIILLTAQASVSTAVAAIKAGAYDYLEKPIDSQHLKQLLEQALERRGYRREVGRLKDSLREMGRFGHMVGQSAAMHALYELIEQVADTAATVLISGESGTGKELIARTLHDMSGRAAGPFVAVNCSAIMSTLWESEMFGFEKGAFTGAHKRHLGYLEQAQGGTLFLDEIGEMSLDTQAKFLRVLETRSLKRVGGSAEIALDLRFVAATNRDLEQAIQQGTFREDLFYRLNVFNLHSPPLRDRRDDIPLLTQNFLREFSRLYNASSGRITNAAMAVLTAHLWPGNVRELRNLIERGVILAKDGEIGLPQLPPKLQSSATQGGGQVPKDATAALTGLTVHEMEHILILQTLDAEHGNKTRAAKVLGISLKTLHNKLARYKQSHQDALEIDI